MQESTSATAQSVVPGTATSGVPSPRSVTALEKRKKRKSITTKNSEVTRSASTSVGSADSVLPGGEVDDQTRRIQKFFGENVPKLVIQSREEEDLLDFLNTMDSTSTNSGLTSRNSVANFGAATFTALRDENDFDGIFSKDDEKPLKKSRSRLKSMTSLKRYGDNKENSKDSKEKDRDSRDKHDDHAPILRSKSSDRERVRGVFHHHSNSSPTSTTVSSTALTTATATTTTVPVSKSKEGLITSSSQPSISALPRMSISSFSSSSPSSTSITYSSPPMHPPPPIPQSPSQVHIQQQQQQQTQQQHSTNMPTRPPPSPPSSSSTATLSLSQEGILNASNSSNSSTNNMPTTPTSARTETVTTPTSSTSNSTSTESEDVVTPLSRQKSNGRRAIPRKIDYTPPKRSLSQEEEQPEKEESSPQSLSQPSLPPAPVTSTLPSFSLSQSQPVLRRSQTQPHRSPSQQLPTVQQQQQQQGQQQGQQQVQQLQSTYSKEEAVAASSNLRNSMRIILESLRNIRTLLQGDHSDSDGKKITTQQLQQQIMQLSATAAMSLREMRLAAAIIGTQNTGNLEFSGVQNALCAEVNNTLLATIAWLKFAKTKCDAGDFNAETFTTASDLLTPVVKGTLTIVGLLTRLIWPG